MTKPIMRVALTHIKDILNPGDQRRMEMPGFDAEFVDFPHYIMKITDRIWHDRQVEAIYDYYTSDCSIHTLGGDIVGAAQVVSNTYDTLKSFPDRRLDGDNVIWSYDGEGHFYSSHLISSKMTNLGASEFGPATGRKILAHTIADCLCFENKVIREWLVRDNAGIVLQMGRDIDETARHLAEADKVNGFNILDHHALNREMIKTQGLLQVPSQAGQEISSVRDFVASVLGDIWQSRDASAVMRHYFDRARIRFPANREFYGPDQLIPLLEEMFVAFPDLQLSIDHIADISYLDDVQDIAVRWSFSATHTGENDNGSGLYRSASKAPVYMMAVSQWRVKDGYILDDITIWDDLAFRRQIETQKLGR
ncbi:MAG: ester cyclase [Pseudomonadota bacterium]|nr:ester cyclase [Pseudomonadota bacterium]